MVSESKVTGFQFESERRISSHEGFCQDSSDEGNTKEWDVCQERLWPRVWWKCKKISTMKTEKECLCFQEVEAVCDFNLQGIFILSQAIFYQN